MKPEESLARIESVSPICYPGFVRAVTRADAFARAPTGGGQVALCLGPSGSGKSTLFGALKTSLFGKPETWLPGTKPVIYRELRNTNNGFFSSKWCIKSLLTAVHDPFRALPGAIAQWDLPSDVAMRLAVATTMLGKIKDHEGDMQDAFVSIARAFRVKLIMLDEANMMCLTQRNRVPTDYLEVLRCLAQEIGCAIILFGSCDLVDMLDYSAQMNRREFIISMERIEEADHIWHAFLCDIEGQLGLVNKPLSSHPKEMYQLTYGVPGEVLSRVRSAGIEAVASRAESLNWEHVIASAPTASTIQTMRREADWLKESLARYQAGEDSPAEVPDELKRLRDKKPKRAKPKRRARRWAVGE